MFGTLTLKLNETKTEFMFNPNLFSLKIFEEITVFHSQLLFTLKGRKAYQPF